MATAKRAKPKTGFGKKKLPGKRIQTGVSKSGVIQRTPKIGAKKTRRKIP